MRKLVIGAATAAFLGTAGPAAAGGMYEDEGSLKDVEPVVPVAIWPGLYVGGTVGFGTGDTSGRPGIDVDFDGEDGDGIVDFVEDFVATDYDMDGAVYGAFVGYNWQRGNAVFGLEAGLNGTDFDGHTDCAIIADCNRELDYYARVVGRLGYAVDNFLFYGFGGVAWGDVETDVSVGGIPVDDLLGTSFNKEQTHVGWTAGAGLEFAFTRRFVAGVEYAHVDLGKESYKVFSEEIGDFGSIDIDNRVDVSFDVIKIRASYKLWHRRRAPLESYK